MIARRTLREFWQRHADAREPLQVWLAVAERADWKSPADIKAVFRSADVLPGNRVVFNIRGNRYRLIVKIHQNLFRNPVRREIERRAGGRGSRLEMRGSVVELL